MIAKYLGNNCPTTPQLAAFVATRIKEFLPAGVLARSMAKMVDPGAGDTDLVQKGRFLDEKEVIMRFLAFTKFPEEFRDKMVEAFNEQSV